MAKKGHKTKKKQKQKSDNHQEKKVEVDDGDDHDDSPTSESKEKVVLQVAKDEDHDDDDDKMSDLDGTTAEVKEQIEVVHRVTSTSKEVDVQAASNDAVDGGDDGDGDAPTTSKSSSSPSLPKVTLHSRVVGGPLLGSRRTTTSDNSVRAAKLPNTKSNPTNNNSKSSTTAPTTAPGRGGERVSLDNWTTFPPIMVPEQSLILLPQTHSITLVSSKTSRSVGQWNLPPIPQTVPSQESKSTEEKKTEEEEEEEETNKTTKHDEDPTSSKAHNAVESKTDDTPLDEANISCVARVPSQQTVWVGMDYGLQLCEYTLNPNNDSDHDNATTTTHPGNPRQSSSTNSLPRRVLALPKSLFVDDSNHNDDEEDPILRHLALIDLLPQEIRGYALVQVIHHHRVDPKDKAMATWFLVQFQVPSLSTTTKKNSTTHTSWNVQTLDVADVHIVDEWQLDKESYTKRAPFQLLVTMQSRARSTSPSTTVFVMVASPSALTVYCNDDKDEKLNHTDMNDAQDEPATTETTANASSSSNQQPHRTTQHRRTCHKVAMHHPHKPKHNCLTAVAVSPNHDTIAMGYWNGEILVWPNLLSQILLYQHQLLQYWSWKKQQKQYIKEARMNKTADASLSLVAEGGNDDDNAFSKPQHPLTRLAHLKLHWHAHPVNALAFFNEHKLYSGGEESVLVGWELERSTYQSEVLPRLSLGAIVHVCPNNSYDSRNHHHGDALLVYCNDNSLQYLAAHNLSRLWKKSSLAAEPTETSTYYYPQRGPVLLLSDSPTATLYMTSLPRAPGQLHGWDCTTQQLLSSSHVNIVAYNRVSRVDWDDPPMYEPCVTLARLSSAVPPMGVEASSTATTTLVTVDYVPTENPCIGRSAIPEQGGVTTLRFWRRSKSSNHKAKKMITSTIAPRGFDLVAAMAFPHGSQHDVSALAVSPNGKYACTVSNTEKAWRLWSLVQADTTEASLGSWTCSYKVGMPSGYSKFDVARDGVAFSNDSTVLAISHGRFISLWDFQDNARLINSLQHLPTVNPNLSPVAYENSLIHSLQFVTKAEMILSVTKASVVLQSAYGEFGPPGWTYDLRRRCWRGDTTSSITHAEYIPHDLIAIATYHPATDTSTIDLVEWRTGKPVSTVGPLSGEVASMTPYPDPNISKSVWDLPEDYEHPVRLYVINTRGVLLLLDSSPPSTGDSKKKKGDLKESMEELESLVPKIPLLSELQQRRPIKRRRLAVLDNDGSSELVAATPEEDPAKAAVSALLSGTSIEDGPILGNSLVLSFVTRNLRQY